MQNQLSIPQNPCSTCDKNTALLRKYDHLIRLYKKKQVQLSADGSQISNAKTTSYTSDFPIIQSEPCVRMQEVLSVALRKRYKEFFKSFERCEIKKLMILRVVSLIDRQGKSSAFCGIKERTMEMNKNRLDSVRERVINESKGREDNLEYSDEIPVVSEEIIKSEGLEQRSKEQINNFLFFTKLAHSENTHSIKRTNMQLEITNKTLMLHNEILKKSLDDFIRRQSKENHKKKESLEMLAEEISEKNEEIEHLRRNLKAYEETYLKEGNVLEEDKIDLRKDLDYLNEVKEKLHEDLERGKETLRNVESKLSKLKESYQTLSQEKIELETKIFANHNKEIKVESLNTELSKLIKSIQGKLKRLAVYERTLSSGCGEQVKLSEVTKEELKCEIVLCFLLNISDENYENHFEMFSKDEKSLLTEFKSNWLKLNHEFNHRQQEPFHSQRKTSSNFEFSEIEMKGQHMESVLNAFDSSKQETPDSSFTIRMLELENEKNKQIYKISELKEKILHIRIIILKLLKSFDIQPGSKTETDAIINVLFDLFEYSEDERSGIFSKKKKLFGLI